MFRVRNFYKALGAQGCRRRVCWTFQGFVGFRVGEFWVRRGLGALKLVLEFYG